MGGPEQPPSHHNNILHQISDGETPLNEAPGKRQLQTNHAYPQIWINHVDEEDHDEDEEYPGTRREEDELDYYYYDLELSRSIATWLHAIEAKGFSPPVIQKYLKPEVDLDSEDDTIWTENLVRVFLPYYDIEKEEIAEVSDGRVNAAGDPIGRCTV